jgi:hypothetical protein
MKDFSVTDDKLNQIAKDFGVEENSVRRIFANYQKLSEKMKTQYLAHAIRSVEAYVREQQNAPFFTIFCKPMSADAPELGIGSAIYQPKQFFTMMFHPRMEEKQLRVCLAHELGHLFIRGEGLIPRPLGRNKGIKPETNFLGRNNHTPAALRQGWLIIASSDRHYDDITEPLSSIFGIFTILEKNDFYANRANTFLHPSWQSVLKDFLLLKNRSKGITNLS